MPRISESTQVAGIDCGKAFLDIGLFPGADKRRVANTPEGHREVVAWIAARRIILEGLEASGGYARPIRDALRAAGVSVRVFDPARVRFFAKAKGQRAKTDNLDAAVIADFTAAQTTVPAIPADPAREEVAGLLKARRLLVDKRADLSKSITQAPIAAREALIRDRALTPRPACCGLRPPQPWNILHDQNWSGLVTLDVLSRID